MKYWMLAAAFLFAGLLAPAANVTAHSELKKEMEKGNKHLKVSCNACHVKGKKKTVRNEFGEALFQEFKQFKFSEAIHKIKDKKKKKEYFEKNVFPEYRKAFKKVATKDVKNKKGDKWADLVKNGKLPGVKLRKKKK